MITFIRLNLSKCFITIILNVLSTLGCTESIGNFTHQNETHQNYTGEGDYDDTIVVPQLFGYDRDMLIVRVTAVLLIGSLILILVYKRKQWW